MNVNKYILFLLLFLENELIIEFFFDGGGKDDK